MNGQIYILNTHIYKFISLFLFSDHENFIFLYLQLDIIKNYEHTNHGFN